MVYNRDRRCVFVGGTMAEAVVAATWLNGQGIPARTMDMMTLGGLEGLTAFVPGISARGVEVWVEDPEDAPEAHQILAEHQTRRADQEASSLELGPITVVCEECGEPSEFPADQRGTMQMCPHCPATLDVEPAASDTSAGDEFEEPVVDSAVRAMLDRVAERFPNFARLAPY